MPELSFSIGAAEVVPYATTPLLMFKLRITNTPAHEEIASVTLQCQFQIEAARRAYGRHEEAALQDLFGERHRWRDTVRTMLWTHTCVIVAPFSDHASVELPVPCSFDFNIAATKYFDALTEGDIPLMVQFSGTVFYREADGLLQAAPIPWHQEAGFHLPVAVWREMMERYYPNTAWLTVHRDVFERLAQYKTRQGLTSWEQAFTNLLDGTAEGIA